MKGYATIFILIAAYLELLVSLLTAYVHFLVFPGGLRYAPILTGMMIYALLLAGPLVVVLAHRMPKIATIVIPVQPLLIAWMSLHPAGPN